MNAFWSPSPFAFADVIGLTVCSSFSVFENEVLCIDLNKPPPQTIQLALRQVDNDCPAKEI
jgi:hypothetical protein